MTNKELIFNELDKIIAESKASLNNAKKVALGEAWKMLQIAIAYVVQILENLATDLSGKEKKDFAIELLSKFYDGVFVIVDIPFVPNVLEPIIHSSVKSILMVMVSASIDATVTIFRKTGIFLKKGKNDELHRNVQ